MCHKRFLVFLTIAFAPAMAAAEEPARPSPLSAVFQWFRSDAEDVIHFRNKDVLRGTVVNPVFTIDTAYGKLTVEARRCAGISFGGPPATTESVVTVNGNRIAGIVADPVIRFRVGTSGQELEIRKEEVACVLLRRQSSELDFLDPKTPAHLFVMTNEDILSGKAAESEISVTTDHGELKVSFAEIRKIERRSGENGTAVVTTKKGGVLRGTLDPREITLSLDVSAQLLTIKIDKLSSAFVEYTPSELASVFPASPAVRDDLGQGVFLDLVFIPAGEFVMGSLEGQLGHLDDETQHKVKLTKPYYLGVTEVTQEQWKAVMGTAPSHWELYNLPVDSVMWDDAKTFCEKLSQKTGAKYRLPTEAEWEYACRAGSADARYGPLDEVAWHGGNSWGSSHPVGGKKANALGLYDMLGNVWEWCSDWYGPYVTGADVRDPIGAGAGEARVLRGGSWGSVARNCRSACRAWVDPSRRSDNIGFRVVRAP